MALSDQALRRRVAGELGLVDHRIEPEVRRADGIAFYKDIPARQGHRQFKRRIGAVRISPSRA
mgnify:CR=1 FL=1